MMTLDLLPPASHLEWSIQESGYSPSAHWALKDLTFQRMKDLDGWCSPFKASILMDLVFWLKPHTILEIGVFGGKSLIPMASIVNSLNDGHVYGIDPWSSSASSDEMEGENLEWWGSLDHEAIYKKLKRKCREYGLENTITLLRTTSEEAAAIGPIDLLHIDGNHSEKRSYQDVLKWVPYVRKGGIIIFDDINWPTTKKAVEWLNEEALFFHEFQDEGSSWGVWIRK